VIKSVLSREDGIYKAFPDLVQLDDGALLCVYRESLVHGARPFGRIVSQTSFDGGHNWGAKKTIHEVADASVGGRLNNPRLQHLGGQRLLLICDLLPANQPESDSPCRDLHLAFRGRGHQLEFHGFDGNHRTHLSFHFQNPLRRHHHRCRSRRSPR
jgi:hypothetical protein